MPLTDVQASKLEEHEGFRSRVYKCPAGFDTIGIGYNLIANPLKLPKGEIKSLYDVGISHDKATYYLKLVCNQIENRLSTELKWFDGLESNVKYVLIDMAYQMGVGGLLKFTNTLKLIEKGRYAEASVEMLDSNWAKQTPNRAKSVAGILKTGRVR
jgi:lysozyme